MATSNDAKAALSEMPSVVEQQAALKALSDCEMVGRPLTGDEARIIGWMMARDRELVMDLGGRSTEFAVVRQLEAIRNSMREGNAPEALKNLSAACATLAAYSIAHGRWAVLEGENVNSVTTENEQLREIIRGFLGIADEFDLSGDVIDKAREVLHG